jgi:1,6-anhydro-N-acetylmuramate kinase
MERRVVGCMTGTSIDALDLALVRVRGAGLDLRAELLRFTSTPLGPLAQRLRAAAEQAPRSAGAFAALARDLSLVHVLAVRDLLQGERADLVVAHGQTIFHAPPLSWQLLVPSIVAQGVGVPVVADLRAADLAVGGQGAPITPLADWVLFRHLAVRGPVGVVNLGGFANITRIPTPPAGPGVAVEGARLQDWAESVTGQDLCACNHVLDTIARRVLGAPYDDGGQVARAGTPDPAALDDLRRVLGEQASRGRSLGTLDEATAWLDRHAARLGGAALCASAVRAIAERVALGVMGCDVVLLAGGGAKNAALVEGIARLCAGSGASVETTGDHAVPIEAREAMEFAVLGALCEDRVPITLPRVTGATRRVLAGVRADV